MREDEIDVLDEEELRFFSANVTRMVKMRESMNVGNGFVSARVNVNDNIRVLY